MLTVFAQALGLGLRLRTSRADAADSPASDEALARRVRDNGDQDAYRELIDRYRGRLLALARRMLGRAADDAEDVVQDALVAAYHRRHTYRAGEPFRPWLYRIAINRCVDRLRSAGRTPDAESLDVSGEVADPQAGPLQRLLSAEQEIRLRDAVETLPPKLRAVFLLRHLDELSYEEIARATDLPMGTVKTHLFRARAELRTRLTGFLEP